MFIRTRYGGSITAYSDSLKRRGEDHGGKEGVLLRKVSAAPICDHFTVVAPGWWIREPVPFLT